MPPRPAPPIPGAAPANPDAYHDRIIEGLKKFYKQSIKPLEVAYKFEAFHSAPLNDADLEANPMVLLFGGYSVGKTTMIEYLVENTIPGAHIGPEPTTDKFMAIMHGNEPRLIPGNAVAVMENKPFQGTKAFGMNFLNRFECVEVPSNILRKITLIDTPGVLSGEKQRIGRQYPFSDVIGWFAGRADRILLLFDAYKLDISDEFKSAIEALQGHDDKVRCVLNKADCVTSQQLMRVYGSLMWSLGRVIKTPEVLRVYVGSFWNKPLKNTDNEALLRAEEAELLAELRSLPRHSAVRKINELVKRARQVKVHALICGHLRSQFGVFGKESKQKKLLENMVEEFKDVAKQYGIPYGDFPNVNKFKEIISGLEMSKLPKLDMKQIDAIDSVLANDIPALMRLLPSEDMNSAMSSGSNYAQGNTNADKFGNSTPSPQYTQRPDVGYEHASPVADTGASVNPFDDDEDGAEPEALWEIPASAQSEYTTQFYNLRLASNKLSGVAARDVLMKLGLQKADLRQIWNLSDVDKDGALDCEEYILACYLIDIRKRNGTIYDTLPRELVPPSKRF